MTLLLLALLATTFIAYLVKGLTGFGPALFVVPFFTLLLGVDHALTASALFDAIAGGLLLLTVFRRIYWRFVWPMTLAIALGSLVGARLVFAIPLTTIRFILGIMILFLSLYLWFFSKNETATHQDSLVDDKAPLPALAVSFLGGLMGGLLGISGIPLVIYMKYRYPKEFFRNQLIVIFFLEKWVRLAVYYQGNLFNPGEMTYLLWCLPALLLGLFLGNRIHFHLPERRFNRVVAGILILASLRILW